MGIRVGNINPEVLRKAFDGAVGRILLNKTPSIDQEERTSQIKENTEEMVQNIARLVLETLSSVKQSKGKLEVSNDLELGKPGKGTSLTSGTFYKLDANGLLITLDYSEEEFCFIKLVRCESFINEENGKTYDLFGREISIPYLETALLKLGIKFKRDSFLDKTKWSLIPVELIRIYYPDINVRENPKEKVK